MPSLHVEHQHLADADQHIARAQDSLARMRANLAKAQAPGGGTALEHEAVRAAERALQAFIQHRELIARTIADLEAGRLPQS